MISLIALVAAASWTCDREQVRVTRHLEDALVQLQTAPPAGLTPPQQAKRAEVLGLLRRYIDEGQFPRSTGPTSPVFVDDEGRHCAMGALLSWTGQAPMVEHIRTTRNLATVPTLADEPGLARWLVEHGLAPEEAALVQPAYVFCEPAIAACLNSTGPVIELANGGTLPGGRVVPQRYAAGVPSRNRCEGEPLERWEPPFSGLPVNARCVSSTFRHFARTAGGFVPLAWSLCGDPLSVDLSVLAAPTRTECMRRMSAEDERALLVTCATYNDPDLCDDSGRFRSARLPERGTQRARLVDWFSSSGIDPVDAGIRIELVDGLEAEAWAHVDNGGTAPAAPRAEFGLWTGHLDLACMAAKDAGVDGPLAIAADAVSGPSVASGCSTAPLELFGALGVALLVTRRGVFSRPASSRGGPSRPA